jgi:hypothetical protein
VLAHARFADVAASRGGDLGARAAVGAESTRVPAARAMLHAARSAVEGGDAARAVRSLASAIALLRASEAREELHRTHGALLAGAEAMAASGDLAPAWELADALVEVEGGPALRTRVLEASRARAEAHAARGELTQALAVCDLAATHDPGSAEVVDGWRLSAVSAVAEGLFAQGEPLAALAVFDRAPPGEARERARGALRSRAVAAALMRVRAALAGPSPDAAVEAWDAAVVLSDGATPVQADAALIRAIAASRRPDVADPLPAVRWAVAWRRRLPQVPETNTMMRSSLEAAQRAATTLIAGGRHGETLAFIAEVEGIAGEVLSFRAMRDLARRGHAQDMVEEARALATSDPMAAIDVLGRAIREAGDEALIVSPRDRLPGQLADAVAARLRDEGARAALPMASTLWRATPSSRAAGEVLSDCLAAVKDQGSTMILAGDVAGGEALFAWAAAHDPEQRVDPTVWTGEVRALGLVALLDDAREAAERGELAVMFAALDKALAIEADPSARGEAWAPVSDAAAGAVAEVAKEIGPSAGWAALAELQARLPAAVEGLDQTVYDEAIARFDQHLARGRYAQARGVLGTIRAHRAPSEEIDALGRRLDHAEGDALRSAASYAAYKGRPAAAFVQLAHAAALDPRPTDAADVDAARRRLVASRGVKVALSVPATETPLQEAVSAALGSGATVVSGRAELAARVEVSRACATRTVGEVTRATRVPADGRAEAAALSAAVGERFAALEAFEEADRADLAAGRSVEALAASLAAASRGDAGAVDAARAALAEAEAVAAAASAAWQVQAPRCSAGLDAEICLARRRAWTAAADAREMARRRLGIEEAVASAGGALASDAEIAEIEASLRAERSRNAPSREAARAALDRLLAAEDAVVAAERAVVAARTATMEVPYTEVRQARSCEVRAVATGVTAPTGAAPGPWSASTTSAPSPMVVADPAIGLAAVAARFPPDADLIAPAEAAVRAEIVAFVRAELGAERARRLDRVGGDRAVEEDTADWLIAWWLAPDQVPEGMAAWFAERWPGVDLGALAAPP